MLQMHVLPVVIFYRVYTCFSLCCPGLNIMPWHECHYQCSFFTVCTCLVLYSMFNVDGLLLPLSKVYFFTLNTFHTLLLLSGAEVMMTFYKYMCYCYLFLFSTQCTPAIVCAAAASILCPGMNLTISVHSSGNTL